MYSTNVKIPETDNSFSIRSDEFIWGGDALTEVHSFVLPILEMWLESWPNAKILDLGCGSGALSNALRKATNRVVGIDSSTTGIQIAQKSFPSVEFKCQSVEDSLPEGMRGDFDVVIAIEVIEHLLRPRVLLQRAREALKPGGVFIVSTPFHGYWKNLLISCLGQWDRHWHPLRDFGHVKFFSRATLHLILKEGGFRIVRNKNVGRIPILARSMMVMAEF